MNQFEAIFLDPISGAVAATLRWDDTFNELNIALGSGPLPTLRPFAAIEGNGLGSSTNSGQLNIRGDRSSGVAVFHIELAGRTLVRQTRPPAAPPAPALVWTTPAQAFEQPVASQLPQMPPMPPMPPIQPAGFTPTFAPTFSPYPTGAYGAHGPITYAQVTPTAQKNSKKKLVAIVIGSIVALALGIGAAALVVRASNNDNPVIQAADNYETDSAELVDPDAGATQPALPASPPENFLPIQTIDERLFEVVNEYVNAANPDAVSACVKETYPQVSLSDLDFPDGVPLLNRALFRCAPTESAKRIETNIVVSGISDADRTCAAQGLVEGMGELTAQEFEAVAVFDNTKLFPDDIRNRLISAIETQCLFMEPEMAARVINE